MGDDRDDPDRTAILRRRNRLIALALSGIGAAAGCGDPAPCLEAAHVEPMPCLEPPYVEPHGPTVPDEAETHPVPCLAPPPAPRDEPAHDEATSDEGASDEGASGEGATVRPDRRPSGPAEKP